MVSTCDVASMALEVLGGVTGGMVTNISLLEALESWWGCGWRQRYPASDTNTTRLTHTPHENWYYALYIIICNFTFSRASTLAWAKATFFTKNSSEIVRNECWQKCSLSKGTFCVMLAYWFQDYIITDIKNLGLRQQIEQKDDYPISLVPINVFLMILTIRIWWGSFGTN